MGPPSRKHFKCFRLKFSRMYKGSGWLIKLQLFLLKSGYLKTFNIISKWLPANPYFCTILSMSKTDKSSEPCWEGGVPVKAECSPCCLFHRIPRYCSQIQPISHTGCPLCSAQAPNPQSFNLEVTSASAVMGLFRAYLYYLQLFQGVLNNKSSTDHFLLSSLSET